MIEIAQALQAVLAGAVNVMMGGMRRVEVEGLTVVGAGRRAWIASLPFGSVAGNLLDAATGAVRQKLPVPSGPEEIIAKDGRFFVRTYDADLVFDAR